MKAKQVVFTVEKTETGFSSYSEDYPIFTTGSTIPELRSNALEAAELYFEEEGVSVKSTDIILELDIPQFFDYFKVINAKHLAGRVGIHPTLLSQYVNGKKKPSGKQAEKLLEGIHAVGKELMDVSLIA
ncbi:MAG: helix-turn-helix transcriptional regulator [Cyclobacteriaceae bacterium]